MSSQSHESKSKPQPLNSEQYRQMLVQDGERRFREWHNAFLAYQQRFLQEMRAH